MVSTVVAIMDPMAAWASPPYWRVSEAAMGMAGVRYLRKMSVPAPLSGRSILIFTSRRPGRRMAGSIRSCRLDAPMTMTFLRPSTPSISARSWGTMVVWTWGEVAVAWGGGGAYICVYEVMSGG